METSTASTSNGVNGAHEGEGGGGGGGGGATSSVWAQFRALMMKNFVLQKHQTATMIVQLFIPFGLVMLVGLVQMLIDNLALENSDPTIDYYGRVNISATWNLRSDGSIDPLSLFRATPFYLTTTSPNISQPVGQATYLGELEGFLGNLYQIYQSPSLGLPGTYWPFCLPEQSEDELYNHLVDCIAAFPPSVPPSLPYFSRSRCASTAPFFRLSCLDSVPQVEGHLE